MPRKHPKNKRLDALELFSYGLSVSTVHFRTGIPARTLYNWKAALKRKHQRQLAKKHSDFAANPPQNPDSRHKTDDPRQITPDSRLKESDAAPSPPENRQSDEPAVPDNPPQPDTDEESTNDDYQDFTYIREQLMNYARKLAADLRPGDPDSNRRTLALSRILDRIQWLDQLLPGRIPEQTIRFEYYYDGQVQDEPPWSGAAEGKPRRTLEDYLPPRDEHESGLVPRPAREAENNQDLSGNSAETPEA